jgi:hypothetical protein
MSSNGNKDKKEQKKEHGFLFYVFGFILEMLGLIPGIYIVAWINDVTDSNVLTEISMFVFPALCMFLCALLFSCLDEGVSPIEFLGLDRRKGERLSSIEKEKAEPFEQVPHFGKLFGYDQIQEFLGKVNFVKYKNEDGKSSSNILISEDDKWACILGGYIPLDLLCGYNEKANVLYTIDGSTIQLPHRAMLPWVRRELRKFFEARGQYYTAMPSFAKFVFEDFVGKKNSLTKADWARIRYKWEKEILKQNPNRSRLGVASFDPVTGYDGAANVFYERVLTDAEIKRAAKAVRKKLVKLSDYLVFDNYKNEFSVCNGIELLKKMDDTKRLEGIDFLFDCLGDVDEAYFLKAAELLEEYPPKLVHKKMEKRARLAYENRDSLKLAGILFLSKRIGYETEFIREKKEAIRLSEEKELEQAIESVTDERQYLQYMLKE